MRATKKMCYTQLQAGEKMKKYFSYQIKKALIVQSLITIESLDISAHFTYPEEVHDFHEFAYIDSGTIECRLEAETITLSQGDFLLIPPQKRHNYCAVAGKTASIFIVCFRCNSEILTIFDKKIVLDNNEKALLAEIVKESKNAFAFPFNRKLKLLNAPIFGSQQLVESNIEKLLIQLVRKEINQNDNIKFVTNSTELENNLVGDIIALLKANLYSKITLTEISRQTFYSKTFLNTIFKKNTGASIMQYYTMLKVDEAKRLLREKVSSSEVSAKLKFESPTYFTKVFKKYTNLTPSAYKKTIL